MTSKTPLIDAAAEALAKSHLLVRGKARLAAIIALKAAVPETSVMPSMQLWRELYRNEE